MASSSEIEWHDDPQSLDEAIENLEYIEQHEGSYYLTEPDCLAIRMVVRWVRMTQEKVMRDQMHRHGFTQDEAEEAIRDYREKSKRG